MRRGRAMGEFLGVFMLSDPGSSTRGKLVMFTLVCAFLLLVICAYCILHGNGR
jgi:hypothetical protein